VDSEFIFSLLFILETGYDVQSDITIIKRKRSGNVHENSGIEIETDVINVYSEAN